MKPNDYGLPRSTRAVLAPLVALAAAACLEPRRSMPPERNVPGRDIGTAIVLSDSAPPVGAVVVVTVRLQPLGARAAHLRIGSYTARLSYDTLALGYVGEGPMNDNVTRAIHATPHLVRAAGFAIDGIATDALFRVRFQTRTARAAQALQGLDPTFTELHSIQREDLRPRLTRIASARRSTS